MPGIVTVRLRPALLVVYALAPTLLALWNAWATEDAYITFRTADNLVHGYGLTWNVGERVQAYTHPLWMLLVAALHLVAGDVFTTSLLLSVALTLATALLLTLRIARSHAGAVLGVLVLVFSKAFVDFSASGLEDPLTHFLLALLLLVYLTREPDLGSFTQLCLIASLSMVNRMDTVLLCLPVVVAVFVRLPKRQALGRACVGFLPFALWETFSLFYYGFLFPNTAYAKLGTGIPALALAEQGLSYLRNSMLSDPVTLAAIAGSAAVSLLRRKRRHLPVLLGMFLYLVYVVKVGGDFMSGRFLTAPLVCAALLLSRCPLPSPKAWLPATAAVAALGLLAPRPTLFRGSGDSTDPERFIDARGVADERNYYYPHAWLFRGGQPGVADHRFSLIGRRARQRKPRLLLPHNVGYAGFFAGPDVHLVDRLALADPLLARLPNHDPKWRIGHFRRHVPAGYLETLVCGENLLLDENLAAYYDKLSLVIRGDLFDPRRLVEIWNLNRGRYDHLLAAALAEIADTRTSTAPVEAARDALAAGPDRAEAWYALARGHLELRNVDAAATAIRQALDLAPSGDGYAAAYDDVGTSYYRQGRVDRALETFRDVIRRAPDFALSHHNLGIVLNGRGEHDAAVRAFSEAIRLEPTLAVAHQALAGALARRGDWAGSLAALEGALAAGADSPLAYVRIGLALERLGRPGEAVLAYEKALALDARHPRARKRLEALRRAGVR